MSEVYDIFVRQYEDNSVPLATLTVSKDTTIGEIKKMLLKNCEQIKQIERIQIWFNGS